MGVAGIVPRDRPGVQSDFDAALTGVDTTNVVAVPMPCSLAELFDFAKDRIGQGVVSAPPEALPHIHRFGPFDQLEVALQTPRFASFILVDYYASDGNVYHLDSDYWPGARFPPGRVLTVGGRYGIGVEVTLVPPPTDELMVVTASAEPLFPEGRPLQDDPDAYVLDLRSRVAHHLEHGGTVTFLATIVSTVDDREAQ
ncbi:MAG: hypothetical protein AAGF49_03665 [Pseudomonadota bacterium]